MKVGIVGRGRAAKTLVPAMERAGIGITWWWSRDEGLASSLTLAQSEVLLFAVSDGAIEEVAELMSQRPSAEQEVWIHLSGSRPGKLLRVSARRPRSVACMHPLQALPGFEVPKAHLEGVTAGIDGESEAIKVAHQLATKLGMTPREINAEHKAMYHAAAVSVAGHATALFSQAIQMMAHAGFQAHQARDALLPLIQGAIDNLAHGLPQEVATGPVARGDALTVLAHLHAIEAHAPGLKRTYLALASEALALAEPSLEDEAYRELERILNTAMTDEE